MQRKHSPTLRANFKASTSFPQSGTELGDIFICGTAKACAVKDCFKRSTHFHCSLCPDRKVVKVSRKYFESLGIDFCVSQNSFRKGLGNVMHSCFFYMLMSSSSPFTEGPKDFVFDMADRQPVLTAGGKSIE